jgi:hypothetical protein
VSHSDVPVLGPLLYGLNVNRMVVRYMAGRTSTSMASGAETRSHALRRHALASVRFVTGAVGSESLASIPGMSSRVLPRGKRSFYDKFPDATAEAISVPRREGLIGRLAPFKAPRNFLNSIPGRSHFLSFEGPPSDL